MTPHKFTVSNGGVTSPALPAARSGIPARASDMDAAKELFLEGDVYEGVLGVCCEGWQAPLGFGTGNFSKMMRLAEVFAPHRIPVFKAKRLPAAKQVELAQQTPHYDQLSKLHRDCVVKSLGYPAGTIACTSGLWVDDIDGPNSHHFPTDSDQCKDQALFVDITPESTTVFVRDHRASNNHRPGTLFHPSISLDELVGRRVGLRVLFGRRSEPADRKIAMEFFDGGSIMGTIVSARGSESPMQCLAIEYVLETASGLTIAEQRAVQWQNSRGKGLPWEESGSGPYLTAAKRVVENRPSSQCHIAVAPGTSIAPMSP